MKSPWLISGTREARPIFWHVYSACLRSDLNSAYFLCGNPFNRIHAAATHALDKPANCGCFPGCSFFSAFTHALSGIKGTRVR